jgi:hypothetical protein
MTTVGKTMVDLGLHVGHPTRVVLRAAETFRRTGLFDGGPDQLGVTSWAQDASGKIVGEITIGIVSGLPEAQFRRVAAHEYGHAALAGAATSGLLSLRVSEGFAETLAALHIELTRLGRLDGMILRDIAQSSDPTYGHGYRRMREVVDRYGVAATVVALRSGRADWIGLRSWE